MLSGPADLVMSSFLICSETILSVTRNSFISLLHGDISRLAPMWQQSGTLLLCSCHGIAGFPVDEL